MRKLLFLTLLLTTEILFAETRSIQIFPLQVQSRYQDTANQSKEMVPYRSFGLGLDYDKYRFTYDYSTHDQQTGNSSLKIYSQTTESLFGASYQVFQFDRLISVVEFDLYAGLKIGNSDASVETTLLNSKSQSTSSNLIFGANTSLVAKWKYIFLEVEGSILNSKDFSPSLVPTVLIKFGLNYSF